MLHLRRDTFASGATKTASVFSTMLERLAASDPGLMRMKLAIRGTLSVFLASLAAVFTARWMHAPPVEFASGIVLSMMAPFLTREPTLRQRQRTLLALMIPAAVSSIGTALLHGTGSFGDGGFLLLVFLCFLLHPRDPRLIGIGLVATIETYVGLYLELPPATLPTQLLAIVGVVPIVAFACFIVVPVNPASTLRLAVKAVQWRAAAVLRSAAFLAGRTANSDPPVDALRRDLRRLNEAAILADDQLMLLQPIGRDAVRSGLIELELATARLINILNAEKPGPRHAIRMMLHQRRVRGGTRYNMVPGMMERGTLRATLVELGHHAHALGRAAEAMQSSKQSPDIPAQTPGPFGWRLATRVTLAAALAMAGGMALSPQRWFWAVITVYVVFLNTRSRGDTIYKGAQRLGGTLLGIVSGLVLTTLLTGDPGVQTAVLLLAIFGMYYFILISYTIGIFCVTMMLGLLYDLLGASLDSVLFLRLEETAIGAVAAVLVSFFVFPTRTRDQVIVSGRGVLTALVDAVKTSREALSGLPARSPLEAIRRVDRQVADLRLALAPLTAGRLLRRRSALERPVPALLDCVHWTRVLASASQNQTMVPHVQAQAARIEGRLARLIGMEAPTADETLAGVEEDGDTPDRSPTPNHLCGPAEQAVPTEVAAALENLERAVIVLTGRLKVGALEGFAVDA